jgi:hypothetical protein
MANHNNIAQANVIIGANKNNNVLAKLGSNVSFTISLKPSAKGCNNPRKPTTLGPLRCCIDAMILRSNNVKNAIATNSGIKKRINLII